MENTINKPGNPYYSNTDTTKLNVSDAEWKKVLSPDLYAVSRNADTERAFTGKLWNADAKGTYYCAACGNKLFRSDQKFASSCGWPSFFEQENKNSVVYKEDNSYGMRRIEALCGRCDGHLGHLFDDGPAPTGKRYCHEFHCAGFCSRKSGDGKRGQNKLEAITLGGGCYWCVEAVYENLDGVKSVVSGFTGGNVAHPTYEEVCSERWVMPKWCKLPMTRPRPISMKYFRYFLPFTTRQRSIDKVPMWGPNIVRRFFIKMKNKNKRLNPS